MDPLLTAMEGTWDAGFGQQVHEFEVSVESPGIGDERDGILCSYLCAGTARCNDAEMLCYAEETDRLMLV